MKPSNGEVIKRLNRFRDSLKRAGVRLTHQRLEVFRQVARTDRHPDAETVYKAVRRRVPAISLDTVYRTLWLLLDLGLITTLGPNRDRARFDANMSSHHHFVCTKCGSTKDFYSREFDRLRIPKAVRTMGRVERTYVEVRGLCSGCSKISRA
jgi:Fur family peroxide stress response transcriptional regulator